MNISIVGHTMSKNENTTFEDINSAKIFSGKAAAVCYMSKPYNEIAKQPEEKILQRLERCKISGHHSVMDHYWFTFLIEDCPKILAMFLNNEKEYATSEKSARYTKMKTEGKEKELYEKWINIFQKRILEAYPGKIEEKQATKLAQENARYLISVFTPATTMLYSTSWRQIQYIMHWMKSFDIEKIFKNLANDEWQTFGEKIKNVFNEFTNELESLGFTELNDGKNRNFSLISNLPFQKEHFGITYNTSYIGTFSELAQLQRHRTIYYSFYPIAREKSNQFYIPEIIKETDIENEWIKDIESLKDNFPQGMLINISERGNIENFIQKCQERLCSRVQLETAKQTADTLERYYRSIVKDDECSEEIIEMLNKFVDNKENAKARCESGFKCKEGCLFGPKNFKNRKV